MEQPRQARVGVRGTDVGQKRLALGCKVDLNASRDAGLILLLR